MLQRPLPEALMSYYRRIGAEVVGYRRALIKEWRGDYWVELCEVNVDEAGAIRCTDQRQAPTEDEATAIKQAFKNYELPKTIRARMLNLLFPHFKDQQSPIYYEFIDKQTQEIIMVQERRQNAEGKKTYHPWTMLETGEWENVEPDCKLPFWKPKTPFQKNIKIMIHEGAKSAQAAHKISIGDLWPDHPWREFLSAFEHWGIVGGALVPHRTEFSELKAVSPREVIYTCDRDYPGEHALQLVSACWRAPLKGIKFGDQFPEKWDMADPIPQSLFSETGCYKGPAIESLIEPATWATRRVSDPENPKKTKLYLTQDFAKEWFHSVDPKFFIHIDRPDKLLSEDSFNLKVRPYSDTKLTSDLLGEDGASKASDLKYSPALPPGLYGGEERFINTFVPPRIKPIKGDCSLWEEYLNYFVVSDPDREQLIRWIATLVCRPKNKMHHGMLLISEEQGIGKTTLGEKILKPLVGIDNVSVPGEKEVVESAFNDWIAHRRLVIVNEIYSGHSWKAYNALKSYVTDEMIQVQKKYTPSYKIDNWAHFLACSNSFNALRIANEDRRWFVPRLADEKRTDDFWVRFNAWLTDDNGVSKILWWLEEWLKINKPHPFGANAPKSSFKLELIENNYSDSQLYVIEKLNEVKQKLNGHSETFFFTDKQILESTLNALYKDDKEKSDARKRDTPLQIRNAAKAAGWFVGKERIKFNSWDNNSMKHHGARVVSPERALANMPPKDIRDIKEILPREFMENM